MRGQTLVEFALVTPLLLLTTLGLMEGGYYAMAITSVNHGTQEGARLAILPQCPPPPKDPPPDYAHPCEYEGPIWAEDIAEWVRYRAKPIDVPTRDVTVSVSGSTTTFGSRKRGDKVIVATAYTHVPLVGYVFPGLTFPMNARSELFVE
jgi:hypothetical protein